LPHRFWVEMSLLWSSCTQSHESGIICPY
jgi:hypothetical protein